MNDQDNLPREDEDVEGHQIRHADSTDEDVEGHRVQSVIHKADEDEDVEGHRVQSVIHKADEDDVEGHRMRHDV